jgi:protocatechuate 4,5-dioxygenase, alpha chain
MRRPYDDIPGTYVFDGRRAQQGLELNRFLQTLDDPKRRERFDESEEGYLREFALTDEQRDAVLSRDWRALLKLGGNIFCIWKLALHDRRSMQYLGGAMTGTTEEEFKAMMLSGGRRIDG